MMYTMDVGGHYLTTADVVLILVVMDDVHDESFDAPSDVVDYES